MANVNDAHGMASQVRTAEYRLKAAHRLGTVSTADFEAIQGYVAHHRDGWSPATVRDSLNKLRVCCERAETPLTDFEGVEDWYPLRDAHRAAGCASASGLNAHVRAVRGLLGWCDGPGDRGDYDWAENIPYATPDGDDDLIDPERIPTEDQLKAMREAMGNPRDKALIEFLADAGTRVALACQLKRGQMDMAAEPPTYRPNPDGLAQKQQPDRPYPLKESSQFMRHWLNTYHDDDHPEAPVFRKLHGYDPDDRENGAIRPERVGEVLRAAAERAGVIPEDPDEEADTDVNPHAFRHLMVARGKLKHRLNWDRIQYRGGWSDRSMSEIRAIYGRLSDEEEFELLMRDLFGVEPDDGSDDADPGETWACGNCGEEVTVRVDECGRCGYRRDAPPRPDYAQLLMEQSVVTYDLLDAVREVIDPDDYERIRELNRSIEARAVPEWGESD